MMDRTEIEAGYRDFQDRFAAAMAVLDGSSSFIIDDWERPGGGGGRTMVLAGDGHIEKAAVNFSAVHGDTPDRLSEQLAVRSAKFFATGVSIIVHPANPHAPTFHANVRYFETDSGTAWFGGGADLTPYYLEPDDARHFHTVLAEVCDRHEVADYPGWKAQCDDYFRLPHRGEARGVGGIFFDHLTDRLPEVWEFQKDLSDALPVAYLTILERRVGLPYGEREREWQLYRRGRYVEFNLVWDRGTRFGLETNGRTESILGSLPPLARWTYDYSPEPGSPEAEFAEFVAGEPQEWIVPDSLLNTATTILEDPDD